MAKNNFLISIVLLVLFFLITLFLSLDSHKKLHQSELAVQNTKMEAEKFVKYRNTWNHSPVKRIIKKLQDISTAKVSYKSQSVKLHFDRLSKSQLNQVMNIIYKKPLKIKKLTIFHKDDKTVNLYLEILK